MRKTAFSLILALAFCCGRAEGATPDKAWAEIYPEIEKSISDPVFPDRTFNPVLSANGLNTEAVNGAIRECSRAGGGMVVIPPGEWLTGPIELLSGVNLHIQEGATLRFTSDLGEYPLVLTRWEGMDCYNYQPMIYAYGQKNIAVTGKGIIDGGAGRDNWWAMCGAPRFGWKEDVVSQRIGRPILMEWNEKGVPVENRRLGDGFGMRVQLLNPCLCENVLIEGVTLLRSPFWVIHPLLCENLTVRGVRVINDGPNGDGCDPESCKNVLIENCFFDTGDDCIAIKSGRNVDGRRWNRPTENVIVRNCHMKNGHGGVVVGSEISGGFRNLFVENCTMDSPELDRVIRIKTNSCRGGVIENIFVRNVEVGRCNEAVLKINLKYDPKEICCADFPPVVRNVHLDNVNCKESRYGARIDAYDDKVNVTGIKVSNCKWENVATGDNHISGRVSDVGFTNVSINGKPSVVDR